MAKLRVLCFVHTWNLTIRLFYCLAFLIHICSVHITFKLVPCSPQDLRHAWWPVANIAKSPSQSASRTVLLKCPLPIGCHASFNSTHTRPITCLIRRLKEKSKFSWYRNVWYTQLLHSAVYCALTLWLCALINVYRSKTYLDLLAYSSHMWLTSICATWTWLVC